MLPWVLDWLKKNNAHKISTVIKFEDADELVKKIDRFMLRICKAISSMTPIMLVISPYEREMASIAEIAC